MTGRRRTAAGGSAAPSDDALTTARASLDSVARTLGSDIGALLAGPEVASVLADWTGDQSDLLELLAVTGGIRTNSDCVPQSLRAFLV